jgi:general secretion pathway protein M
MSESKSESPLSWMTPLRQGWRRLPARQQQALAVLALVLLCVLAWSVAVQPALKTLQRAAAESDRLDEQLQVMQRLAQESRELQRTPPVAPAQAAAALQAATERLGPGGRLLLQGDRAVLNLQDVGTTALSDWLLEVRTGARAQPLQADLTRGERGYAGTLVLLLGSGS